MNSYMIDDGDDVGCGLLIVCRTAFCLAEAVDNNISGPEHPVLTPFLEIFC